MQRIGNIYVRGVSFERRDDGVYVLTVAMQNCWLARLEALDDVSARSEP